MKATGSTAILQFFAKEMNCVLTELPEAKETDDNIFILYLQMNQHVNNLIMSLQNAFTDGKISDGYFKELDNLSYQIIEIIQNFRAGVELMRKKYEAK